MTKPRTAVQIWEDVVGDSGDAPTDAELKAYHTAVALEVLEQAREAVLGPSEQLEDAATCRGAAARIEALKGKLDPKEYVVVNVFDDGRMTVSSSDVKTLAKATTLSKELNDYYTTGDGAHKGKHYGTNHQPVRLTPVVAFD